MNKFNFLLGMITLIVIISSFSFISASSFGYSNSGLPKVPVPSLSASDIINRINYTEYNVNNSVYWQGHTGTDGSWLTGVVPYTGATDNLIMGSKYVQTPFVSLLYGGCANTFGYDDDTNYFNFIACTPQLRYSFDRNVVVSENVTAQNVFANTISGALNWSNITSVPWYFTNFTNGTNTETCVDGVTVTSTTSPYYNDTSNNYTVHMFTSNGTFNITGALKIDFLIIAGGGAGGSSTGGYIGGAGGGGGYNYSVNFTLPAGNYTIVVGSGGVGVASGAGGDGSNSSIVGIVEMRGGGGGGAGKSSANGNPGRSGGSGGGGGGSLGGAAGTGGAGTTGQGYNGGNGGVDGYSGGGGGAGGAGGNSAGGYGAAGASVANSINGTSVAYSGGGTALVNNAGKANQGWGSGSVDATPGTGRNGSSGVVIIKYSSNTNVSSCYNTTTNSTLNMGNIVVRAKDFRVNSKLYKASAKDEIIAYKNSTEDNIFYDIDYSKSTVPQGVIGIGWLLKAYLQLRDENIDIKNCLKTSGNFGAMQTCINGIG